MNKRGLNTWGLSLFLDGGNVAKINLAELEDDPGYVAHWLWYVGMSTGILKVKVSFELFRVLEMITKVVFSHRTSHSFTLFHSNVFIVGSAH